MESLADGGVSPRGGTAFARPGANVSARLAQRVVPGSVGKAVGNRHQHEGDEEHLQQIGTVAVHRSRSPGQGLPARVKECNPEALIAAAPAGPSPRREGDG